MAIRVADFHCKDCGKTNEILYKTDSTELKCPDCGSENLEKMLSAPPTIDGRGGVSRTTPAGFKEILKQIHKTTPEHYRGAKFSAI